MTTRREFIGASIGAGLMSMTSNTRSRNQA